MKIRTIRAAVLTISGLFAAHLAASEPPPTETVEVPAPTGSSKVGTTTWHVTELLGKPSPLLAKKETLPEVTVNLFRRDSDDKAQ